jgi:2-dehydro-3-deoxygalactonokinase
MPGTRFIAGDWGTTQLRLFLCSDDAIVDTRTGRGIGALERSPQDEFAALTQEWLNGQRISHAVLCGMVGSRNGWRETAYVPCPASFEDLQAAFGRLRHADLPVMIVPGLSCVSPIGAPDVMRGEETQIFGALRLQPTLTRGRHVLALPGTHTKWVSVEAGRVVQFQTAFTGELFALLRTQSTLLKAGTTGANLQDTASFDRGLAEARGGALLHRLFQVRSRQLLEGMNADQATSLLSGLLLGSDIDQAVQSLRPERVTLVCEPQLALAYARALDSRGVASQRLDGNECVLAALRALATEATHR